MLHVSTSKKRRVKWGARFDFVMIGKIADDDGDGLLLVFVNIDRTQADEQLIHPGKKSLGPHHRSWGRFRAASLAITSQPHWKARFNSELDTMHHSTS